MAKNDEIELEAEDGSKFTCRIIELITFRDQEYGVMINLANDDLVVLKYSDRGAGGVFRRIDDDAEFEAVVAFIRALADQG